MYERSFPRQTRDPFENGMKYRFITASSAGLLSSHRLGLKMCGLGKTPASMWM
ncbi:uncharacterized protein BDV17DRAFT_273020, partial [Aspergillus undulatus]|uniref:uncharacterized protein n=1 Tax=Aspergillus undulatus TaxID=1810928 RepID=UPI003CCDD53D